MKIARTEFEQNYSVCFSQYSAMYIFKFSIHVGDPAVQIFITEYSTDTQTESVHVSEVIKNSEQIFFQFYLNLT